MHITRKKLAKILANRLAPHHNEKLVVRVVEYSHMNPIYILKWILTQTIQLIFFFDLCHICIKIGKSSLYM